MEPLWLFAFAAVALFLVSRLFLRGAPRKVLLEKIAAGAKIVDVRSPVEFAAGAYPGAVNIPLHSLAAHLAEIPKERPVVVYCASGARSAAARSVLMRAGYADVVNAGGLSRMPR